MNKQEMLRYEFQANTISIQLSLRLQEFMQWWSFYQFGKYNDYKGLIIITMMI